MVDIRRPVCGILVAGSPAPGINGVISAAVIQCIEWGLVPIGFTRGFKYLKQGLSDHCVELKVADVTRMHNRGGSLLATSKEQLDTDEDVANVINVLRHLKVRYLITIGGTSSAFSAHKLATALRERTIAHRKFVATNRFFNQSPLNSNEYGIESENEASGNENESNNNESSEHESASIGARINITTTNRQTSINSINSSISNTSTMKYVHNGNGNNSNSNIPSDLPEILITHVPKTIFNDLPLPDNCYTFGFSTARELGYKIVSNLSIDAKTMHRWYVVTCIGSRTGHLGLSIGKASAATITLIPEQFRHRNTAKHKPKQYNYKNGYGYERIKKSGRIVKQNANHKDNNCDNESKDSNENDNNDYNNSSSSININNGNVNTTTTNMSINTNVNGDNNNNFHRMDSMEDNDTTDDKFKIPETPSPSISKPRGKNFNSRNNNTNDKCVNFNIKSKSNGSIYNDACSDTQNEGGILKLSEIVDIIDACMIKRLSQGKDYGVAVISEGLVDMLDINDLNKYFDGSVDKGHELLGPQLQRKLARRWSKRRHEMYVRSKFIGFELRSDDPNAHDIILSRNLGYAAVFSCKVKNINATIVAFKGGELVSIPLSEMMDPDTNSPTVKGVNIESLTYTVAQSYMIKLTKADLKDRRKLKKMAEIAGLDLETFRKQYSYIAA